MMSRTRRHHSTIKVTRPQQVTNANRFFESVDGSHVCGHARGANSKRWRTV